MSSKNLTNSSQSLLQKLRSNDISTPVALADYRTREDACRYKDADFNQRMQWLGQKIVELNQILHKETVEQYLNLDVAVIDDNIMADKSLSDLTFLEINEAFNRGVCGAFGPYFGLNALSMLDFLRAFNKSEKKLYANAIESERDKVRRRALEDAKIRKEVEERNNAQMV